MKWNKFNIKQRKRNGAKKMKWKHFTALFIFGLCKERWGSENIYLRSKDRNKRQEGGVQTRWISKQFVTYSVQFDSIQFEN